MNKTIIAIHGRANEGKSETIKKVCELLVDTFPKHKLFPEKISYQGDILQTIKIGEVKIGLEGQGDPKSRMISDETLELLAGNHSEWGNCDIIICATRTSGETVQQVDKIADEFDFHTLWLSSFFSPKLNYNVLNRIAAENIIGLIKSIISEQI